MSNTIELTIFGEPMGKLRPRYSMYNGIVRTYTPQKTINYESLIAHEYNSKYGKLAFEKDIPVKATITAYFALSQSDYCKSGLSKSGKGKMLMGYCTKNRDIDNIAKIVLDALNSICFVDDKQVVLIIASKKWTEKEPRVEVKLENVEYETSL